MQNRAELLQQLNPAGHQSQTDDSFSGESQSQLATEPLGCAGDEDQLAC
jgi:hypothetical protein